jgi:hypothetical protein
MRGSVGSCGGAAFKSKSARPFAASVGWVDGPGPGGYDMADGKGIADKAAVLAREAARLAQLGGDGRPVGREGPRAAGDTPGPGAYAPNYDEEQRQSAHRSRPSAVFLSGSRRIGLPWAGGADGSPEVDASPGPGEDDTRGGTPRSARRAPVACFGSSTTPRFGHEPHPDDLTPPPGAYFCSC